MACTSAGDMPILATESASISLGPDEDHPVVGWGEGRGRNVGECVRKRGRVVGKGGKNAGEVCEKGEVVSKGGRRLCYALRTVVNIESLHGIVTSSSGSKEVRP